METLENKISPLRFVPLAFGVSSVFLSAIYMFQRSGMLWPYSADRFVQHHLDLIGNTAAIISLTGLALSLILSKRYRNSKIVKVGTVAVVVSCVMWLLQPL
jgi:hypothetical protein